MCQPYKHGRNFFYKPLIPDSTFDRQAYFGCRVMAPKQIHMFPGSFPEELLQIENLLIITDLGEALTC
jgi:hypothetical protein